MATRQQIIQRARELIVEHPNWGKDTINKQLRKEYGIGLRRIEVAKLRKELVSPVIREQTLQVQRYQKLRKEGFLKEEADFYKQFPVSQAGVQKVRRFRQSALRKAERYGISKAEQEAYIKESYKARGYVTKKGELQPDAFNTAVYYELQKPVKDREQVLIPPDRYEFYKKATKGKISRADSLRLAQRIPPQQWAKRIEQYNILRKAHFTHFEALKIITTKTKADAQGRRRLQNLNLNQDVWKKMIKDRQAYFLQQLQRFINKGLSKDQAIKAFDREVSNYYKGRVGDTRADKTPWDWLREYYKFSKDKKVSDFATNKQLRQKRFTNKKMPYRAR